MTSRSKLRGPRRRIDAIARAQLGWLEQKLYAAQLHKLAGVLQDGETVHALAVGRRGPEPMLLAITDRRLIYSAHRIFGDEDPDEISHREITEVHAVPGLSAGQLDVAVLGSEVISFGSLMPKERCEELAKILRERVAAAPKEEARARPTEDSDEAWDETPAKKGGTWRSGAFLLLFVAAGGVAAWKLGYFPRGSSLPPDSGWAPVAPDGSAAPHPQAMLDAGIRTDSGTPPVVVDGGAADSGALDGGDVAPDATPVESPRLTLWDTTPQVESAPLWALGAPAPGRDEAERRAAEARRAALRAEIQAETYLYRAAWVEWGRYSPAKGAFPLRIGTVTDRGAPEDPERKWFTCVCRPKPVVLEEETGADKRFTRFVFDERPETVWIKVAASEAEAFAAKHRNATEVQLIVKPRKVIHNRRWFEPNKKGAIIRFVKAGPVRVLGWGGAVLYEGPIEKRPRTQLPDEAEADPAGPTP